MSDNYDKMAIEVFEKVSILLEDARYPTVKFSPHDYQTMEDSANQKRFELLSEAVKLIYDFAPGFIKRAREKHTVRSNQ